MSRKNTQFKKGLIPWNKGKTGYLSDEAKAKMGRKGIKRQPLSDITKKRLSDAKKGKPKSEETKEKLSQALLGRRAPHREGANCNWWKGGYSTVIQLLRKCFRYRQWVSDIFERDNYTCQDCSKRGGKLNAHHVISFSQMVRKNEIDTLEKGIQCEELWNINNGQTLCVDCHRLTDNFAGHSREKKEIIISPYVKIIK